MKSPGAGFGRAAGMLLVSLVAAAQSTTVNVQVGNQTDTTKGVNGRLQVAMSTSFQLAGWDYQFFDQAPGAQAPLTALNPFHTRVQVVADGIPLKAPDTWDFTELNDMLSAVQATGDHSPEFQIGTAPSFLSDSHGYILPASFGAFADMSANLVRYYNTGGFDVNGTHFQSPTPYAVTWWGIFNEPDGNGLTAQQYVTLYNTVVPAMAKVDPNIKFVAIELSYDESFVPTFAAGVTAPVDVVAAHFYSTCDQNTNDQSMFSTVPGFADRVRQIYSDLQLNPALAGVPVWVTENNVNADYDIGNGISACNGSAFVLDQRGTSAFFAAWRPLVFMYLGQAGAQALYHWAFGADQQYGEVDGSANTFLSYWMDYYLSHWLPSPPGQDILQVTASGCCATDFAHHWMGSGGLPMDTTTLAVRNVDGSVVILMSNYALNAAYDNNGPGLPRTFSLDLSSLGTFTGATLVTLDASTPAAGPAPVALTPSSQMTVTISGYGSAFLRLYNAQPALRAANPVVNAASYASGAVAPGELIALFGSALGPSQPGFLTLTNPGLVANSLSGVHVLFDGVPAPLIYAASGQINAVVPYSVAGKSATHLQVEYLGAVSPPVSLPVVAAVPGLFTHDGSGQGQGAIVNLKDFTINSAANPAAVGEYVSLYGAGAGQTTPAGVDGLVIAPPYPQLSADVKVTIGGLPASTSYAGPAPSLVAGVLQINAQIPEGVTPGPSVPVVVSVGDVSSQSGVTVAVK